MARGRNKKNAGATSALPSSSDQPFTVTLTNSAREVYISLHEQNSRAEGRGEPSSQHCTTFRMVDDAIRRIIPADPANRKYALHRPLEHFYRIQKGRMRIVWAVSTEHREILIVYISTTPRKAGDAQDPYVVLERMRKAGYLTEIMNDWRAALAVPRNTPLH